MGGSTSTPAGSTSETHSLPGASGTSGSRMPTLNNLENVLQAINQKYISLPDTEVRRNKEILEQLVDLIVTHMKQEDELFARLYSRIFYGGSFYDGLRVGKPEEFDLDLLLRIPKGAKPDVAISNAPGFVWTKIGNPELLGDAFKRKMLNDNYLSTEMVLRWIEGVFTRAMNKFPITNGVYQLKAGSYLFEGRLSKSGPAMTLKINCKAAGIIIDIDLVPCFEFGQEHWPVGGYKPNPVPSKNTFFIVPKSPKQLPGNCTERYWRLSFQEQERQLINGKRTLKPTVKLCKRLRDVQNHKIVASYYIKTIFLHEDERNGPTFWNGTLSETFLKMLDAYIWYLEEGKIPYFWNRRNNLLSASRETITNIKNQLVYIRKDILAKKDSDPKIICKYLDTPL